MANENCIFWYLGVLQCKNCQDLYIYIYYSFVLVQKGRVMYQMGGYHNLNTFQFPNVRDYYIKNRKNKSRVLKCRFSKSEIENMHF